MRNIINISLPKEMRKVVEDAIKSGNFATKSEFFRVLLRAWQEEQSARALKESEAEFRAGKGKVLHSLRDLR